VGMRVAIVGSGVSGLVSAHLLHPEHQITMYEADNRVGGHVNTVTVELDDGIHAVDTGFIVYNERTYPAFTKLLAQLGVQTQPSDMSFSVSCAETGLEYRTTNANTLFAQRRNLARPSFLRLLADIPRFNRGARRLIDSEDLTTTLADFLDEGGYSRSFVDHYIVPLGASIWSADPARFSRFPMAALARFFDRHGLTSPAERPRWRSITGGAARYVERLVAPFEDRIRLGSPVRRIERDEAGVTVYTDSNGGEHFDRVVLATHSDQSLRLLARPTPVEEQVLGAIGYQPNRATLHTDRSALPRSRRAWAGWNYIHLAHHGGERPHQASLTYNANRLQSIASAQPLCTTLNRDGVIDPAAVIASFDYEHPVFDETAMRAQRCHDRLNGTLNTYYCGAYWGWGFHEDGVQSALVAMRHFGRSL
jgi:predicted NAD/FAD-binding protein